MTSEEILHAQLPFCLTETHFDSLGVRHAGKVRDCYVRNGERIIISTDRLSCFDVVLTSVPFKGQVLTELALYWFDLVREIVPIHLISQLDPNVIVGKESQVIPLEVVTRAYLTGSAWRDYSAGGTVSGISLPPGLKKSHKFPTPLLTPATKAAAGGHDMPISEDEIIRRKIVSEELWNQIREVSGALFALGSRKALERGLLLVDTKYEFGLYEGKLILVDEIHTLDSSRYWVAAEYQNRFELGQDQIMLDKEPTRQWLLSRGYQGEGIPPEFTEDHRVEIAKHYISSYEKITGTPFLPALGDPLSRIKKKLELE